MVENIDCLRFLGGEPLLYPQLAEVLQRAVEEKKVFRIDVVTNGTMLPREERIYELLKNQKVTVHISDYGKLSRRKNELVQELRGRGILVEEAPPAHQWIDYGSPVAHGRTELELKEQLLRCQRPCMSYFNGRLYSCARVGHGMELGLVPDFSDSYARIADDSLTKRQKRKELRRFLDTEIVHGCDYCNVGTDLGIPIPVAEQLEPGVCP